MERCSDGYVSPTRSKSLVFYLTDTGFRWDGYEAIDTLNYWLITCYPPRFIYDGSHPMAASGSVAPMRMTV